MAGNYSGYFLKGLAGGLQTGVNLGTQIQEMQWQKAQRKKLEEKEAKIEESMSTIGNLFKQYGADSTYSDDEIMQLNTALSAAVPEVQAVWKDAVNAIQTMNKRKFEEDLQWFDLFINQTEGLNPGDVQGIFDMAKSRFQTDKAKNYFTAYEEIQKKKYEAAQNQPEDVWGQAGTLPQDIRPEYLRSKGVNIPQPTAQPQTELDKMGETQKKLDYAYATGNANYFNQIAKSLGVDTTFETYKQKFEKPGAVGGAEKPRVTSLPQLEEYRDKALNADSWKETEKIINDYTEAGYDATQLGVTKEAWANTKKSDLDNLVAVLDEITAGTSNIKSKEKHSFEINGKVQEQTGEEWYKQVYESYVALLKLLEEEGIDTSQYKKLKPLSEIKAGFLKGLTTFGGVGKGDLVSIYY